MGAHQHWNAAAVRAKADALQVRGAGRITLAAETIDLLVAALRFMATEGMAERRMAYTVDVWDARDAVTAHVADLSNRAAARAAFLAACEVWPDHEVTLRQGIRVMERRDRRCDAEPAIGSGRAGPCDPRA